MTSKSTVAFRQKICAIQQAIIIHGATLTIHPDGVYLNKRGITLAVTWEDVGELLGESWDDFFGKDT